MALSDVAGLREALTDEVILSLTTAMDLDEDVKLYHCWRVAVLMDQMAQVAMPEQRSLLFFAGLLHEVGGIGAPMHMLHYPLGGPKKRSLPREVIFHAYYGAELVRMIPGLRHRYLVGDIVLQHHEHYDGTGFPNGLQESEILPEALLLHAADLFDFHSFSSSFGVGADLIVERVRNTGNVPPRTVDLLQQVVADEGFLSVLRDTARLQQIVGELYAQHRLLMFRPIQEGIAVEDLFTLVGMLIDRKHSYTQGHSARVASYATTIGKQLGLSSSDLEKLRLGAFVHDIGKLGVPRYILDSEEPLTPEQWKTMRNHARVSWDMLNSFPSLQHLAFAALHHERWDGQGYPLGLARDSIPRLARILSAADALDGMTSIRSYRPVWTFRRAVAEILGNSGSQFDPEVAQAVGKCFYTVDGVHQVPAQSPPVALGSTEAASPAGRRYVRTRIRMRRVRRQ